MPNAGKFITRFPDRSQRGTLPTICAMLMPGLAPGILVGSPMTLGYRERREDLS